jgi:tetratricopeptide (TPR) repeat protein
MSLPATGRAETLAECQELWRTGQYEACLTATTAAIDNRSYGEEWPLLKAVCELTLGRCEDALDTVKAGVERYSWSVRLRLIEYQAALATGRKEQAAAALQEIEQQVSTAPWRYTDADDLAALGQAALALGADPKAVQEGFFERARRNYPTRPDGFVAAARLALAKGDVAFAAELLTPVTETFKDNPDVLFLMSQALRGVDREKSVSYLQQTLEINPQYVPALLQIVEQQIDGESWDAARATISQLLSLNAGHPESLALLAVIQHIANDPDASAQSLAEAQKLSGPNAAALHLAGRKLSQKYRFREGAALQRLALEADPKFTDARIQLAQDLLRLGEETDGWKEAEQAHREDGYNTTLFNLLQLKDSLERFTTLHSGHFEVRMETTEAAVYGPRVVELLELAWAEATTRYEFTPELPVYVEIYARADDFAVRTFGMPDVAGFLGVCFGRVITANSPASRRDTPTNWESVLWHEFFHVVTLQKTGNRIPRWLSEGISVFEEQRRDPRWGQRMNASFRDRILEGDVTPVAELSSAFLNAESGADLEFAYFESSKVVEHLVGIHGLPAMNAVLVDLNSGVQINDALERHTGSLAVFEKSFRAALLQEAEAWATGLDFDAEPLAEIDVTDPAALEEFRTQHPESVPAQLALASQWMNSERFAEAEKLLRELIDRIPEESSSSGPRPLLAAVYRRQDRTADEAAVLRAHLEQSADDLDAALRLQELAGQSGLYEDVLRVGELIAAIDPFQVTAARQTASAAESLGRSDVAIAQLERLRHLQPDDAARLHFRMAGLLRATDIEAARRQTLLALELAPRFREAHRLLLELQPQAAEVESPAP